MPPGFVTVQGTVSDANSAGFAVVTSSGTRVPVTTSRDTNVTVRNASLGQLQVGATTFAVGYAGPDGTLSARAVTTVSHFPPGARIHATAQGCSPASIAAGLDSGG